MSARSMEGEGVDSGTTATTLAELAVVGVPKATDGSSHQSDGRTLELDGQSNDRTRLDGATRIVEISARGVRSVCDL